MIYYLRRMTILIVSLSLFGQYSFAKATTLIKSEVKSKKKYANRRLLVRYKEDAPLVKVDAAHFSVGAFVIKSFDVPSNLDVVEISKGISLDAALEYYRENKNIMYAEPDYEYHALFESAPNAPVPSPPNPVPPLTPPNNPNIPAIPSDPDFSKQWALNNVGQNGGTSDVDLNGPEMWSELPGDKSIVTVVIDTGINYNHPDLKKRAWVNIGEIPNNGIDDDGNGVIDDVHGFNAIASNGDPMDDHGHGTHCAGTIAAEGNNGVGVVGVNPLGTVMGCKFLSANGSGSASGAIECLNYVRDLKKRRVNPVNIVATSNSWGGGPSSQALEDAIREHKELGILFIAAASNDGDNNDDLEMYPANYNLANIVAVGATDKNDNLAEFSNYGKRTVHVAAPGVEIYNASIGNTYEFMDGTSMATPFVTGLASMIKAHDPSLNYMQIKNLIMAGGVPVPSLAGKTISGRRIRAIDRNGRGSLSCRDQIVTGRLSPPQDRLLVPVGQTVMLSAININCAEPNGSMIVPISSHGKSLSLTDSGLGLDSAANDGVYTNEWKPTAAGHYEFRFPNNDVVTINVYDPASMSVYEATSEASFQYRQFTGSSLGLSDDAAVAVRTPFPIKFGSENSSFEELTIDANGVMSVTSPQAIGFNNQPFPILKNMSLIAPFWDDLNPGAHGGDVLMATAGQAPNRELIVEWRNVRHYNSPQGITFQVVFFENSSDILFNYLNVDFGSAGENKGASATVGVQTSTERSMTYSHNQPKLENRQSLRFSLVN